MEILATYAKHVCKLRRSVDIRVTVYVYSVHHVCVQAEVFEVYVTDVGCAMEQKGVSFVTNDHLFVLRYHIVGWVYMHT